MLTHESTDGDAAAAASPDLPPVRSSRPTPFLLLAGAVALLVPVQVAGGPIRDIDLYWHLLLGQDVLAGLPVSEAARGWSFSDVPDTWVSTQWLAEVLFAWLYSWGGLQSLIVYRTVMAVAVIVVLALVTLRRRPPRAGVWPFAIAAITMAVFAQERSQMLTFVLAPLVGWWAFQLGRHGRNPRWWVVAPVVVVWANVHGGWVLVPIVLGLSALARVIDHGRRDRAARTALLLSLLAVAAACVSPSGIGTVLSAPRFASSTAAIAEWQRVELFDWAMVPYLVLLAIVIGCWARGRARPSVGELVLVGALVVFSLSAWRNVTPVVLVLAPVVTGILARALGDDDPTTTRPPFVRTAVAMGAVGAAAALVVALLQTPVVDPTIPTSLLTKVRDEPGTVRVLNNYNISGPLLWFGGGPDEVQVAIDGRADRYGGPHIDDYLKALAAVPGWERTVDALDPQLALLRTDDALSGVLVAQRQWTEVAREGDYVLLRAPSTG